MPDERGKRLTTLATVIVLLLLISWLAFDQLRPEARSGPPPGPESTSAPTPGSHQPGGDPSGGSDSSSALGGVGLAGAVASSDVDGAAHRQNSPHSDGIPFSEGSDVGTAGGDTGPGPGSGGPAIAAVTGGGPSGDGGSSPDVSASGEALRSGPVGSPGAPPGGNGGDLPPTGSGSAPPMPPANGPGSVGDGGGQAGLFGPPGGPMATNDSGAGPSTGSDVPHGAGNDTPWTGAATEGSSGPIAVPLPPSLLLFGGSALMLWAVSRRAGRR